MGSRTEHEYEQEHGPILELLRSPPSQLSFFDDDMPPETELIDIWLPEEECFTLDDGLCVVQSEDGLSIEVSGYGARLSRKGERITLKTTKGKILWQVPFDRISEIFIRTGGISISTDAIIQCARRGIRIIVSGPDSKPQAIVTSPALNATVAIKRAQFNACDNQRGLEVARAVLAGKIKNQSNTLKYFIKSNRENNTDYFEKIQSIIKNQSSLRKSLLDGTWTGLDLARPAMMGIEGTAARIYWNAVSMLVAHKVCFEGRKTRGARDFVNSCLNYGYGILYGHVWGAVLNAGLEPFGGFLHTDRPGKPSMVLDMIEPFRAPVVDRTVIAGIRTGKLSPGKTGSMLDEDLRAGLAESVLARLDSRESFKGRKYRVRSIIQMQCRQTASFLTGRNNSFKPFSFKW